MPAIPVNKVVDPKRLIRKNGGPRRRRRESNGVTDPPPKKKKKKKCNTYLQHLTVHRHTNQHVLNCYQMSMEYIFEPGHADTVFLDCIWHIQGDQIGRILAFLANAYFGQFFENYRDSQNF
jgi:hypothetical protein